MIIINTEAGELRIDDDKEENHEDDISDVARVLPDQVDRRGIVHGEGADSGEVFDQDAVDGVDTASEEIGHRTKNPSKLTSFLATSVGSLFFPIGVGFVGGVGIGSFRIGGFGGISSIGGARLVGVVWFVSIRISGGIGRGVDLGGESVVGGERIIRDEGVGGSGWIVQGEIGIEILPFDSRDTRGENRGEANCKKSTDNQHDRSKDFCRKLFHNKHS